jgi:hypothetical protein
VVPGGDNSRGIMELSAKPNDRCKYLYTTASQTSEFVDKIIAFMPSPSSIPNGGDSTTLPYCINTDSSKTSDTSSLANLSTRTQAGSDTAATSLAMGPTPPSRSSTFHTPIVTDDILNKLATPNASQPTVLSDADLKSPVMVHDELPEKVEGSNISKVMLVSFTVSSLFFKPVASSRPRNNPR